MDPINYTADKSPFDKVLSGFQSGLNIRSALDKQQEQAKAYQQAQQMKADINSLANNKNASAQDYASMMTKYPSLSEHFKQSWDVLNEGQQRNKLDQATQVHAALIAGKPEIAKQLLKDQAAALRNSGNEEEAKSHEVMAKFIETSPDSARTTSGLLLSSVMGADKFGATFASLGQEQRSAELQPMEKQKVKAEADIKALEAQNTPVKLELDNYLGAANVKNINSQISDRSARLKLDQDRLQSDVDQRLYDLKQKANNLDDGAKKLVNDSTVASIVANQASGQMMSLADQLEKSGASAGIGAKGAELYKSLTGDQNAVTALRQEYVRLRNTQALKMLPPGPATDKDIQLAMKGFPEDTADPKAMASFLRGMSKMNDLEAVNEAAKAEWINSVGHLGKAKSDVNIDGVAVPAGTNFLKFSEKYVNEQVKKKQREKAQEKVKTRSYNRFLTQPSVGAQQDAGATGTY